MRVTISMDGVLGRYAGALAAMPSKARSTMAIGLNSGGRAIRRETIAAETAQTGLRAGTIRRAQVEKRASPGHLEYEIWAKGGNVRLKYFGARETRAGVSAAPWNQRQVFPGTFIKGGRFPKRVGLGMGGHVFRREGADRLPIQGGRSGLYIPTELITGQTAAAFQAGAAKVGPIVVARLGSLLP